MTRFRQTKKGLQDSGTYEAWEKEQLATWKTLDQVVTASRLASSSVRLSWTRKHVSHATNQLY